jgi:5-methylthioadenosine/S-adenosylhomocysteine deaminase
MCKLCMLGLPQNHHRFTRRNLLKGAAALGAAASTPSLFAARAPAATAKPVPRETGLRQTRYIIRGGAVMSMDPAVGDFPKADVLVEGN